MRNKKETPYDVVYAALEEIYGVLQSAQSDDNAYWVLDSCITIIRDTRVRVDYLRAAEDNKMRMNDNSKQRKMLADLKIQEDIYRSSAKTNPSSVNATRAHLDSIDKCVAEIKRLRNRLGYSVKGNFLQDILYGKPPEAP